MNAIDTERQALSISDERWSQLSLYYSEAKAACHVFFQPKYFPWHQDKAAVYDYSLLVKYVFDPDLRLIKCADGQLEPTALFPKAIQRDILAYFWPLRRTIHLWGEYTPRKGIRD